MFEMQDLQSRAEKKHPPVLTEIANNVPPPQATLGEAILELFSPKEGEELGQVDWKTSISLSLLSVSRIYTLVQINDKLEIEEEKEKFPVVTQNLEQRTFTIDFQHVPREHLDLMRKRLDLPFNLPPQKVEIRGKLITALLDKLGLDVESVMKKLREIATAQEDAKDSISVEEALAVTRPLSAEDSQSAGTLTWEVREIERKLKSMLHPDSLGR